MYIHDATGLTDVLTGRYFIKRPTPPSLPFEPEFSPVVTNYEPDYSDDEIVQISDDHCSAQSTNEDQGTNSINSSNTSDSTETNDSSPSNGPIHPVWKKFKEQQDAYDVQLREFTRYQKLKAQSILILRNNCDEQRKSMIQDFDHPAKMMKFLKECYASQRIQNLLLLNKKFLNFKVSDDKPVMDSIVELQGLQRQ
jgi:hypothetical protein